MPAKSKAQQAAFAIAEQIKKGKMKAKPGTPSAEIAKSASLPDIREFSSTPTGGLPKRVKKKVLKPAPKVTEPTGMTELPPSPAPPMAKPAGVPRLPKVPPAVEPTAERPMVPAAPPPPPAMPPVGKRPPIFGMRLRKKFPWR